MSHRAIEELLPWYANGTLDAAEMTRVAAHLECCAACRTALELELRISRVCQRDPVGLPSAREAADAMFESTLQMPHQQPARGRWEWMNARPTVWVGAVCAVLGLAIGLSASISQRQEATEPERQFTPMTSSAPTAGRVIQVVFHLDAQEAEIRALLLDLNAELIGSPSINGVYRLAVPEDLEPAEIDRVLGQHDAVKWSSIELPP